MTKKELDDKGWFWKPVALFLLGSVLSLGMMVAREHVMLRGFCTKAEAKEMIRLAPYPWIEDRKYVLQALQEIKADVSYIKKEIWNHERLK
jgi:hypothetical protein